ncbi:MAG: UV DNA damage repair endonuclease UvsE [Candidatus Krumholzibacteriota bacterium]|nr:UV DNA damage repair endonuclease UvsE [Candidatus Krumholzibacteriota bacterium]
MRIGYPCINRGIGCTSGGTFRLANYSGERLVETVDRNLDCLEHILRWNRERGLFFFRISSDIVPFASHPVCTVDWAWFFRERLRRIGRYARRHGMRLSMHPDQFVVINSPDDGIVERSVRELEYHVLLLDAMELGPAAKIQIHVGGVYGDRERAIERFVARCSALPAAILRRLVVENDDRLYNLRDVIEINRLTGRPVVLDVLHHRCLNNGESFRSALLDVRRTWRRRDGAPIVDYSSQQPGARPGRHAESVDPRDFRRFLLATEGIEIDVMLEIKDKEASALLALAAARRAGRLG